MGYRVFSSRFYYNYGVVWEDRNESTGVPRLVQSTTVIRTVPKFDVEAAIRRDPNRRSPKFDVETMIIEWIYAFPNHIPNHFHFNGMTS